MPYGNYLWFDGDDDRKTNIPFGINKHHNP